MQPGAFPPKVLNRLVWSGSTIKLGLMRRRESVTVQTSETKERHSGTEHERLSERSTNQLALAKHSNKKRKHETIRTPVPSPYNPV